MGDISRNRIVKDVTDLFLRNMSYQEAENVSGTLLLVLFRTESVERKVFAAVHKRLVNRLGKLNRLVAQGVIKEIEGTDEYARFQVLIPDRLPPILKKEYVRDGELRW